MLDIHTQLLCHVREAFREPEWNLKKALETTACRKLAGAGSTSERGAPEGGTDRMAVARHK